MTRPVALTDNVIDSILQACGCRTGTDNAVDRVDREALARSVRQISAAFERASNEGDIAEAFGVFGSAFLDSRVMLLSWLDLLEEIVQIAEQRFGTKSGQGKFKAEQVKAAIRRTIEQSKSPLRQTVATFGPGAIDIVLDAALVVVVGVLNTNESVWDATKLEGEATSKTIRFRVMLALARWFGKIYGFLSLKQPLDPELVDEVDRIVGARTDPLSMLESAVEVGLWIGSHPGQVESFMLIVGRACDEAERFSRLDGPTKQAYARELIFLVLEEQFGVIFGSTTREILAAVVDLIIDFVVSVNNKRGGFKHSDRTVIH